MSCFRFPGRHLTSYMSYWRNPDIRSRKMPLMKQEWPDTFVEEGNLTQMVFLLRKALGDADGGQSFIMTVPRQGYRFTGEVRGEDTENSGAGAALPQLRPRVKTFPIVKVSFRSGEIL